ncbi:MAG: polysaccharide deacetylase family protein [Candidatus Coatesbacteria bacterium]|nr:polysaccharide deacetylase family protein [Candidatus Coatesbacteria bacterium]
MEKAISVLLILFILSASCTTTTQYDQSITSLALIRYYYKGLAKTSNPRFLYNKCISKEFQKTFTFGQFDLLHKGLYSTFLEELEIENEDSNSCSARVKVFFYTKSNKTKAILYEGKIDTRKEEGNWKIVNIDLKKGFIDAVPRNKFTPSSTTIKLQPCNPLTIIHGDRNVKQIALTFDATGDNGPAQVDMPVYEVLRKYDISATFFLETNWIIQHQELVNDITQSKIHSIGMLSTSGIPFEKLAIEEFKQDLIEGFTNYNYFFSQPPRLYRPADQFRDYSSRIVDLAAKYGMVIILWEVDLKNLKGENPGIIAKNLLGNLKNGTIIAFPIDGRSPQYLAEVLEVFIPLAQQQGYVFVPISKLRLKIDQ